MIGQEKQVTVVPSTSLTQPTTPEADVHTTIMDALAGRRAVLQTALTQFMARADVLAKTATLLVETLRAGHKVLIAGNGGSAAEAQHFAAELVGRFKRERDPYAVLSLTTDTSILTAIGNDYGYADVFARQVGAFGQPDDVFIAISTSGSSENLIRAAVEAHNRLMPVIAITGDRHSRLETVASIAVRVPHVDTAIVQELHMTVTHILCDIVETALIASKGAAVE